MAGEPEPNQPDPWAASIKSGTAPKPKAKPIDSWKSFKPGEAEPLPEDLSSKPKAGSGRSGRGGGGSKFKAMPSGPNLPRQRVTPSKIMGQVIEWKGKYGWIMPTTPVQHPKAFKHQGKIFISVTDLDGRCRQLAPGSLCEFFVFEDDAGLGAEECIPMENSGSAGKGSWPGAFSSAQSGGSRPSADGRGRGNARKGAGGKSSGSKSSGAVGYTGLVAPDIESVKVTAADIAAGKPSSSPLGKGGGDMNAGKSRGRGGGGKEPRSNRIDNNRGCGAAKGGKAADASQDAPHYSKSAFDKGGPSSGPVNGSSWDAFMSQRSAQDQSRARETFQKFPSQAGFAEQSRPMEPLGHPSSLLDHSRRDPLMPPGAATYFDQDSLRDQLMSLSHGGSLDLQRPPDFMMPQPSFVDPNRGAAMVQSGPVEQQLGSAFAAAELMRTLNMQPSMGSTPSALGPNFGAFPPPDFSSGLAGFDLDNLAPGGCLGGFPGLTGFPVQAPSPTAAPFGPMI
jgi:hypothetical protein